METGEISTVDSTINDEQVEVDNVMDEFNVDEVKAEVKKKEEEEEEEDVEKEEKILEKKEDLILHDDSKTSTNIKGLTTTSVPSVVLPLPSSTPLPSSINTSANSELSNLSNAHEEERTPVASTSTKQSIVPEESTTSTTTANIYGVCLISFDHSLGPIIEWAHPHSLNDDHELVSCLPFLALPDGAHTREEDYSYFHLLLPLLAESTIFGISCNRQIPSSQLINKGKEVTRSTVQKAIVVLASKPIFGPLRDKLGVITRAFFAQKDFEDKSILMDLHSSLETPLSLQMNEVPESEEEQGLYMGTSLRELVHTFRFKTLMLLKLLLLQKRVMFYAATSPVESLCTFQYSLVALVPALLAHLDDSASPDLDAKSQPVEPPTSLRTSDKQSLLRYLGLPLHIFGKGAFFQPYLPLQQIDYLQKTDSFLVGTTNSIFQQQRDCPIDVLVNLESASLEIADGRLAALLVLTAADRKWMDEMVSVVDGTWNAVDPSRPVGLSFIGSDDYIRAKFEEYICSMLACIKLTDFLANEKGNSIITGTDSDANMLTSFNQKFITTFKETPAFKLWNQSTDAVIFDLVEPKHPMEGKTTVIEDVGIRLAHGLNELHIEENLAPTREAITRGLTTGSDTLWNAYSSIKNDLAKRQTDRSEKQKLAQSSSDGTPSLPSPIVVADYTAPILAGVDVAKTQAASLATGLGSFFASKRTQFFSAPSPTSPTTTSSSLSSSNRPSLPSKPSRTPSSNSFEHSLPSLYPEDDDRSQVDVPLSPTTSLPSFGSLFKAPSVHSLTSGTSSPISNASTSTNTGIGLGAPPHWPGNGPPSNSNSNSNSNLTMTPSGNFFSTFSRRVSETLAVVENNVRQYATEGVSTPGGPVMDVDEEEDERYQEEAVELAKVRDLDKEYEERLKRQADLLKVGGTDRVGEGDGEEEEEGEDFEDINLERSGELGDLEMESSTKEQEKEGSLEK